jgi:hypothetical protein
MTAAATPVMDAINLDGLRWLIDSSHWTFARSMPHIPHEYTLRRRSPDEEAFERFVLLIAEQGYVKTWRGTPRRYLDIDGWKYWTMGAPLAETILINRARISE